MRVRWTEPAVRDLTGICDYIEARSGAETARRVALRIYERVSALEHSPMAVVWVGYPERERSFSRGFRI
jgi:plasmid stabilization system protein ParE